MDAPSAARVREWLRVNRGTETQEDLAAAITQATGWKITRDRYSKYESGKLPIGPKVLGHFVGYWKGRGIAGPFEPVKEVLPPPDPLVAALNRQAAAIEALVRKFDQLASSAIRQGVADALREAGVDPTDGEPPTSQPDGLTA